MREIKFRQWINRVKQFHYFEYVDGRIQGPAEASLSANPINQFTGLRDKNRKEIYEGDILRFMMSYKTETWIGEVKYEEGVAGFMICAMKGEPWCSREFGIDTLKVEIIGNIHE